MVQDFSRHIRRGAFGSLFPVSMMMVIPSIAAAEYVPPAGYAKTELVTAANTPLVADGLAVSGGGRLATVTGSTITLYSTWKNGRSQISSVTDSANWGFLTDPVFVNEDTIVFGENNKTNTLWSYNFTTAVETKIAPSNSLPAVQGVSLLDSTTALVSGTTASFGNTGGFYLDKVNLFTGAIASVASNVGTGFVGGTGITTGGNAVLLDTGDAAGLARVYNPTTNGSVANIGLANGNGSGAYGITVDPADDAFITTGATITKISGLDSVNPVVSQFGEFSEGASNFPFPTGIAFTGSGFLPSDGAQTGALIVNGGFTFDGQLFAVTSVPEPRSLMMVVGLGCLLVRRSSPRSGK